MTPRENMKRAVEFRRPERLPVNGYGDLNDTVRIHPAEVKSWDEEKEPGLDQWRCRWEHTDTPNMGQVKGHPLEDLSKMDEFPWPDGDDPRRYENVPGQLEELENDPAQKDKYRFTSIFMLLWERMQALRGFENCMMDMMDNRPEIHELADRIADYDLAVIRNMRRIAGGKIDALSFTEDWGTETDLMVSPELFRSFFAPRYKKIFKAARDCGWHVWMHSCGKINKAIPLLIEAGAHVLNMQQPLTNGVGEIGREFAGKVVFETLCDIQKTLPNGDKKTIRAEAAMLMKNWGTPEGGFILGDYGDAAAIGTDPANKEYMLNCFLEQDPWKRNGF